MKTRSKYRILQGSERKHPKDNKRIGPAEPTELVTITLMLRRRPGGSPSRTLEEFSKTASKRMTLTHEDFAGAHGAAREDLDRVTQFARSQGLEVLESNSARRSVVVRGTVAKLNKAFALKLEDYDSPLGKYHSYTGPVRLPSNLAGIVLAVVGLDNGAVPARHHAADPPNTNPLTPLQVAQLYNFPNGDAAGQTIGIYEMPSSLSTPGYTANDLSLTMNAFGGGLTAPTPTDVSVDGQTNSGISDPETVLDITVSSAIAQKAAIAVYFTGTTPQNIIHALQRMIHPDVGDPVPTILSISYGWSPDDDTFYIIPAEYNQMNWLFEDAAVLGITVLVSTGDSGAFYLDPTQAQASYPATDPWVVACGGTTVGNIMGSNFDEYVWNDSWVTGSGATGGGVSALWPVPSYQSTAGVPLRNGTHTVGRGIPDVAGNASVNSGYPEFIGGSSAGTIGGTSAVAPLYAGLIARINALLGCNVGFIDPLLYASAGTAFRDIVGSPGPSDNSFGGVTGYPAHAGWDACTGLGSVKGKELLKALVQAMGASAVIDPGNPFNFANWGIFTGEGADDNEDDVEFGQWNHGDPGDPQGRIYATIIENSAPTNAAIIGRNIYQGDGTVGVFGTSSGATRSIGVAGESQTGCGVYGIGTFGTSIGVAGRSMDAASVEDGPLEEVLGEPTGVLGHSTCGAGVRGHGRPLLPLAPNASPLPSLDAAPGGIFSSGQLQEVLIAEGPASQKLSVHALAQLRLIPSTNPKLPVTGRLGDLYVNVTGDVTDPNGTLTVSMYLCIVPGDSAPGGPAMWAPFHFDAPIQGG